MCDVCFQQFGGWCKAFTKTERLLSILEGILLAAFIGFISFIILHLIVCPSHDPPSHSGFISDSENMSEDIGFKDITAPRSTLDPGIKCTWKPSKKTKATTHYYEYGQPPIPTTPKMEIKPKIQIQNKTVSHVDTYLNLNIQEMFGVEESDGEEPERGFDKLVIALVKIQPMRDITFGCVLTIVSEYWTVTAASCLGSIEEVDSLDSFVMLEGYGATVGGAQGRVHAVGDVRVHPLYGGGNRSYDAAALRSDDRLKPATRLRLPGALDASLITMGERLIILGYGRFRTFDKSGSGRHVRAVHVYSLARWACASDEAWELRHLAQPAPLRPGACAAADLCAGPLYSRGVPCNYCSGTPLLAGRLLLGIMADNQQCGVSCEPARYVNVAELRDWLHAVFSDEIY